ncbi:MAG: flagellar filament capping protein FliD, partial [Oscillospiraceae bacterium]|nr:flagellar filament capping protein FliD [Oscillospiraceae bacterium]
MASINSLMSSSTSSTSSIYGNSNIISGLASGMDTEAMIENAVSGIKNKIASFNQNMVMLEWEQNAYRSIIDKMVSFSEKYLSFTSSTNLRSTAFFDSATKTTASGTYANFLSVSGKSNLDFEIMGASKATTAVLSGSAFVDKTEGENVVSRSLETILKDVKANVAEGETAPEKVEDLTLAQLGISGEQSLTVTIGGEEKTLTFNDGDTVGSVLSKISKETGIEASYSTTTGQFYLKSETSGAEGTFTLDGTLATSLFGVANKTTIEGKNAELEIRVNGEIGTRKVSSATNSFDIDGIKVTVKNAFTVDEDNGQTGVSFEVGTDTDKIVNAIKSMVEDFNTMANEIKDAYTTKPLTQTNGKRYKPLTEEDAKDMSEDAIKKYEEKAKKGLLFADRDLSGLYDELRSAISDINLEKIGISTAYENGKTTLKIDEDKLRNVVENDLDAVKEAFTAEPSGTNRGGLMYNLNKTAEKYTKTTGAQKGILIELAGSEKAPASISKNDYKTKMDMLQEQITRWQEKLSDKVDYYTRQFTALEKLIS